MADDIVARVDERNERLRDALMSRLSASDVEDPVEGGYPIRNDDPPDAFEQLNERVFPWAVECAVFNSRNEVLLIEHRYYEHDWQLPGGGGEVGENPEDGAVREVAEETGISCTISDLLTVQPLSFSYDDLPPVLIDKYVLAGATSEPEVDLDGIDDPDSEVLDVRWFAPEDVPAEMPHADCVKQYAARRDDDRL